MSNSPHSDPSAHADRPGTGVGEEQGRHPLPHGTIPVAIGLLINGISSYAFFVIGGRHLGDLDFKPINALWFATFALAPGFFLPLEQELGRAISQRLVAGQGPRPLVRRVVQLGAMLATIVTLALLIFQSPIAKHYFEERGSMVMSLGLAFLVYAPTHIARGICSGHGRFAGYGVIMGLEGVLRVVGVSLLALFDVRSLGAFGVLVALSPIVGLLWVALKRDLRTDDGPPARWAEVTPNLGWLVGGSVFAAILVNAGPITTNLLADASEHDKVTWFGKGVLLGRIPLFLFQAVQAALLPRLARQAAAGHLGEFREGFQRLMRVVTVVAVVGTLGALLIGPPVLNVVFDATLDRQSMAALALGSGGYMLALAVAQALIALQGHARVAIGWAVGVAAFVGVTAVAGPDTFRRVEFGLLAGSFAALAVFLASLRSQLARGPRADAGSILEALAERVD